MKILVKFDIADELEMTNALFCLRETMLEHKYNRHKKLMIHGRPHYIYRFIGASIEDVFKPITCTVREINGGVSIAIKQEEK